MAGIMGNLLKASLFIVFLFLRPSIVRAQSWTSSMDGLLNSNLGSSGIGFQVFFNSEGLLGKDWMYGGFWDEDTLRRCVAYRAGGKWVPLPFHGYKTNRATSLEMFEDTLYIGGYFADLILDKDSSTLPTTSLLKWFNDSLWAGPISVNTVSNISTKGDSILFTGGSYYNPPQIIYTHYMSPDRGRTWQHPASILHPTENPPDWGASTRSEFLPNGNVIFINNGTHTGNPFRGMVRWDGQQWHPYGNGLFGGTSRVFDFDFYKEELIMGGTFNQRDFPNDPGNYIARWDGISWNNLAEGTTGFVSDLFVHDSILYCHINGGQSSAHKFGDISVPYFAGWNGIQWCATPFNFSFPPNSFGFINDTLYTSFVVPSAIDGINVGLLAAYSGDYFHGPNSICSTLGLGEDEHTMEKTGISIYPNPSNGILNITLPREVEDARLSLFSLSGQLVFEQPLTKEQNQLKLSASLKGLYLAVVESDGEIYTEKVLVE
jgi:hypothetical protein